MQRSGLAVAPPVGWTPVAASTYRERVPGTLLSAWNGPDGASLVVYQTLPDPGGLAEVVGKGLETHLVNLPGMQDITRQTITLDGHDAARVEATAPGVGDALSPTGQGKPIEPSGKPIVPTHRVCVGIPGPSGTLWLAWHYPETARATVAPQVDATLKTVALNLPKLGTSSY